MRATFQKSEFLFKNLCAMSLLQKKKKKKCYEWYSKDEKIICL